MEVVKRSSYIIIFALLLLVGCGTYNNQPKIQVTHVLAVTEQGDIIVGKVIELAQLSEDGKRYVDKSVSYDNEEPGRIVSVITRLDGEDRFVKLNANH